MRLKGKIALAACAGLLSWSSAGPTAAQERRPQVAETTAPAARASAGSTLRAADPGAERYECQNYECTCTIGNDCREMFDTLSVVNCGEGGPGELICEVEPRD